MASKPGRLAAGRQASGSGFKSPSRPQTTAAARRRGERKIRGLTCANCRARKVRCEGSQPTCKTCEAYNDECRYEKAPPMSQILAMAKRLQEAEETIALLQRAIGQTSSPATAHSSVSSPEQQQHIEQEPMPPPRRLTTASVHTADSPSQLSGATAPISKASPQEIPSDVSLDKHGRVCFYGPTSAVHEPPSLDSPSPQNPDNDTASKSQIRSILVAKSKESRMWEDFALRNAATQSDVPRPVLAKLLQLHWTWISPMFLWVYRPAFMRDMATGGPYYSEFLMVVLCAHAARFYDKEVAEMLIARARMLLGNAIHQPSSIPTVQALLQLSGRDLAYGSISHAWLYSGMAFRMARDLGLHHSRTSIPSLGDLTPVDVEVRRRLFWSCYFWDKAISLYTGRMPALTELPDDVDFQFLDDSADYEIWSPFITESQNMSRMAPGEYPPMKSQQVSCFANSCKLAVIINDIISKLYSRRSDTPPDAALKQITSSLDAWRAESPIHLRYDADKLPEICPPPHILSQNLLYYTTIILAHRPFWSGTVHYMACINAAKSSEKLLLLLERTFGFENISYLMAYCIYTGASAMLQDANRGNSEASAKIQTFIRALEGGIKRCPLLERSLDIIKKGLKSPVAQPPPNDQVTADIPAPSPNYIPAFPYIGLMGNTDTTMGFNTSAMNVDAFSSLDGFPEVHTDMGNWFWPSQI